MSVVEGFNSDALRSALAAALTGKPTTLEDLLCRFGACPGPRPNLRLAAAFGAEIGAASGAGVKALLERFASNDASVDTPHVFLPLAGAHGWAGRLRAGRDVDVAWRALAELAADPRAPVRIGTRDALLGLALREGGGDELVERALAWLDEDDYHARFAAAALVLEVLTERRVLAALARPERALDYLTRVLDDVAGAPRSAERSDGRRRVIQSLSPAVTAAITSLGAGDRGPAWLEAEAARARHPDVRDALSSAILAVPNAATSQRLRSVLEGSAKPERDASLRRRGTGRGKSSRRIR